MEEVLGERTRNAQVIGSSPIPGSRFIKELSPGLSEQMTTIALHRYSLVQLGARFALTRIASSGFIGDRQYEYCSRKYHHAIMIS